jgi:hypothetical protein
MQQEAAALLVGGADELFYPDRFGARVRASAARSAHHHRARHRPHRDDRSAGGYRGRAKILPGPNGARDRAKFPPVNNRFGS